jgi:hypothetical protein
MSTTKPPPEALVPIALEELANVSGATATSDQMSQVLTQIQTSISTLNKGNSGGFSSTDMMLLMMVMLNSGGGGVHVIGGGGGGFGGYGGYGYGNANVIVHSGGGGYGGWPGGFIPGGGCGGCCGCCGW